MDNPKVRINIHKHVCAVDKKERYFTTVNRATPIDDETLIKYASDDSGIRIEQIAAVYRSHAPPLRSPVGRRSASC